MKFLFRKAARDELPPVKILDELCKRCPVDDDDYAGTEQNAMIVMKQLLGEAGKRGIDWNQIASTIEYRGAAMGLMQLGHAREMIVAGRRAVVAYRVPFIKALFSGGLAATLPLSEVIPSLKNPLVLRNI